MQRKTKRNLISRILCMMLIVAMALFTVGCKAEEKETPSGNDTTVTATADDTRGETAGDDAEGSETVGDDAEGGEDAEPAADVTELGEGAVSFDFSVTDKEGAETKFVIHTDKTTVGDALLELGLIEGEESEYGLYVKKVNGIVADYDVDKTYWAFYVNGEYAMSGVDTTNIEEGKTYSFVVSK